jgi:hypothetical protein
MANPHTDGEEYTNIIVKPPDQPGSEWKEVIDCCEESNETAGPSK